MKGNQSPLLARRARRGAALLLVLTLSLVFLAAMAGMQTLVVIQAGVVTRALAAQHASLELRSRVVLAFREAMQASLDVRDESRMRPALEGCFNALGVTPFLASCDTTTERSGLGDWIPLAPAAPSLGVVLESDILDCPRLGLRPGMAVERGAVGRCRVGLSSTEVLVEFGWLGRPLGLAGRCFYDRPSEVGAAAQGRSHLGLSSPASSLDGGLLRVPGSAPYHFRDHLALSFAYDRLFSSAGLARIQAAAGKKGFVSLAGGKASADSSVFGPLARGRSVLVDLSSPLLPSVLYVSHQDARMTLSFQGGAPSQSPLVVCVVGNGNAAALAQVNLSTIGRPVILLCSGVALNWGDDVVVNGGLLLGPTSLLPDEAGRLHVAHVSCHASQSERALPIACDQAGDRRLDSLYPRVHYAFSREVFP